MSGFDKMFRRKKNLEKNGSAKKRLHIIEKIKD